MTPKRGLGRGLAALLGDTPDMLGPEAAGATRTLPVEFLRPSRWQPRRLFDEEDLNYLSESIRSRGVIQPILVRSSDDDSYEIIAGERRWRAAQKAGLHEVPVLVRDLSDREALEVALIENVQRRDLSAIEEAAGYQRLLDDFGHSQAELATSVGKSRSHVANTLRLLGLPERVRGYVDDGQLSAGHARALIGTDDPGGLADIVIGRDLSVRQTEELVRHLGDGGGSPAAPRLVPAKDAEIAAIEHDLGERLGLRVTLRPSAGGMSGTLRIAYSNLDQLDDLLARFAQP